MRHLGCLLLLGALARAGELAPVTLPVASQGVPDKADDADDRVVIAVDRLGHASAAGSGFQ